jgi:hypothetical protein
VSNSENAAHCSLDSYACCGSVDPLRVLRAVRFAARFNFELEASLVAAASDAEVRLNPRPLGFFFPEQKHDGSTSPLESSLRFSDIPSFSLLSSPPSLNPLPVCYVAS